MKRLAQLVVLAIVALIATQPLLAYASCASEQCVQDACPTACCAGMNDAAMHSGSGCHSQMAAQAMNTGCGLSSPTLALVAKEQASAGQALADSRVEAATPAALPPFAIGGSATFAHSQHDARESLDRGVRYRVFRV